MGLDSYLSAKKHVSGYDHQNQKQYNALLKAMGLKKKDISDYAPSGRVDLNVAYWRKANQIHNWFVREVQNGEDDCGSYYVSREQLGSLVGLCKQVLAEKDSATSKLPTSAGFFFGSYDYDERYVEQLEDTVKQVESILNNPVFDKTWNFEYQASW